MRVQIQMFIAALVMLFLLPVRISAQDGLSGTITYQQVLRYTFDNIKKAHGENQQTQYWIATLPKEETTAQVLSFNREKALFTEVETEKEARPPGLQRAITYENSLLPPRPVFQKVYFDFEKSQKLEQVEYLTRIFLVKSDLEAPAWKLGSEKKKILDYTCMRAAVTMDDLEIVAWFSPELPVSLGPAVYGGLPGLILAVERNGETAYLATSVDLTPPSEGSLLKPDKGNKVSREQFASIQEEKEKEWKENSQRGRSQGENYHR